MHSLHSPQLGLSVAGLRLQSLLGPRSLQGASGCSTWGPSWTLSLKKDLSESRPAQRQSPQAGPGFSKAQHLQILFKGSALSQVSEWLRNAGDARHPEHAATDEGDPLYGVVS